MKEVRRRWGLEPAAVVASWWGVRRGRDGGPIKRRFPWYGPVGGL